MFNQQLQSRGLPANTSFEIGLDLKSNHSAKYKHLRAESNNLTVNTNYLKLNESSMQNQQKTNIGKMQRLRTKQNSSPTKQKLISQSMDNTASLNIKNRFEQIKKKYDNGKIQIEKNKMITNPNMVLTEVNKINIPTIPSGANTMKYLEQRRGSFNNKFDQTINYQDFGKQKINIYNTSARQPNAQKSFNNFYMNSAKNSQNSRQVGQSQEKQLNTSYSKQKYKFFRALNPPQCCYNSVQKKEVLAQSKPFQKSNGDKSGMRSQKQTESIDFINQKIDKIMNCIKNNPIYENQNYTPETNKHSYQSLSKRQSFSVLDNKRSSSRQLSFSNKPQNKANQQIKSAQINNNQQYRVYQPQIKVSEFNNNDIIRSNSQNRSINAIPRKQFQHEKNQEERDLDEQIRRIQEKIKKSQEEKKKLNIKFQGYLKNKPNQVLTNYPNEVIPNIIITKPINSPKKLNTSPKKLNNSPKKFNSSPKKLNDSPKKQNNTILTTKGIDNRKQSENNYQQIKILNWKASEQLSKPQPKPQQYPTVQSISKNKNKEEEYFNTNYIKKNLRSLATPDLKISKTVDQRQFSPIKRMNREKQLQEINQNYNTNFQRNIIQSQIITNQSRQIIESFRTQISLDQKLREYKLWFSTYQNPEKWKNLQSELKKYQINWDQNKIIKEFDITPEQHDPFYQPRQSGETIQALVKVYFDADRHWGENIKNQFTIQILEMEGIREELLDLQKKGYLTVEDFVRLVNLQTQATFFRNRDFILFFRRLIDHNDNNKITFKEFLSKITRY